MSQFRKLQLEIPEDLLNEVEEISGIQEITVEEFVNKSLRVYIRNYKKLKTGYEEMAKLNEEYAEMCLSADNQALEACEEKLSESEKRDS